MTAIALAELPLDPATDGWWDTLEHHENVGCADCNEVPSQLQTCSACTARGCACLIVPDEALPEGGIRRGPLCIDCIGARP